MDIARTTFFEYTSNFLRKSWDLKAEILREYRILLLVSFYPCLIDERYRNGATYNEIKEEVKTLWDRKIHDFTIARIKNKANDKGCLDNQ
jgi:hypothetical protein